MYPKKIITVLTLNMFRKVSCAIISSEPQSYKNFTTEDGKLLAETLVLKLL